MKVSQPSMTARRIRRGMGLVEIMIALSISAGLLTATAFAIDASIKNYKANQEQALLMQQARVALTRIARSIRMSGAHAPITASAVAEFKTGKTVNDSGIAMEDWEKNDIIYRVDPVEKKLLAQINDKTFVLAHGVDEFVIRMEPARSEKSARIAGPHDLLRRATINLVVRTTAETATTTESTHEHTVTLSTSVAPRQNAW